MAKVGFGAMNWILGGLVFITLYFQTTLADPFNSPKLWILLITAAWLFGYLFGYRKIILLSPPITQFTIFLFVFLVFLILATAMTDQKYVAFFGETQRRNGFFQYTSLLIVSLASAMFIRIFNVKRLFLVTYFIAFVTFTYSLMQTTGNDFASWDNPYNSIISTVGNPNFAAALMAVMGVLIFSSIFNSNFRNSYRIGAALLALLLVFMIYRSNARQGLLSFAIGVGIFSIIWIWGKNRKLGISTLILGVVLTVFSVLGMLQVGPLEKILYKPSVSIRGYYWRAGFEMLRNHPFLGVGIDRYGSYFKQYREVEYPLNVGFELTSTNAHNTFIQFFATGGIFLGASYLALNLFVLYRAIIGIKNLTGNNRHYLVGIFSAWMSFHAQSLISIDNIGISIWGWVLAGATIGLSLPTSSLEKEKEINFTKKKNEIYSIQRLISSFFTMLILSLVVLLYQGENLSYKGSESINLQDTASRAYFKELQLKLINKPLNDPSYRLVASSRLIQAGFEEGLDKAEELYRNDPRNLDTLNVLAETYEQLANLPKAIYYRQAIANLDPWNAKNYLALGNYFKQQGDLVKTKEMLEKILSFASANQIADQAKIELAD